MTPSQSRCVSADVQAHAPYRVAQVSVAALQEMNPLVKVALVPGEGLGCDVCGFPAAHRARQHGSKL